MKKFNSICETVGDLSTSNGLDLNIFEHYWYNACQRNIIVSDSDANYNTFTKRLVCLLKHELRQNYNDVLGVPTFEMKPTIFLGVSDYNNLQRSLSDEKEFEIFELYGVRIKKSFIIDTLINHYKTQTELILPEYKTTLCLYIYEGQSMLGSF